MINKTIDNNDTDNFIIFEGKKQQVFAISKEESQMFSSKNSDWVSSTSYTNNTEKETENREAELVNNSTLNANWNATDYIGMSNLFVPYNINTDFCIISVVYLKDDRIVYLNTDNITTIARGVQRLKIPASFLDTAFLTPDDHLESKTGEYVISILPKYFDTNVINILDKQHFPINNLEDGEAVNRRTIYELDESSFNGTPWNFEGNSKQSGRLLGSVVEVLDINGNVKQVKVIAENDFKSLDETVKVVLSMDNFGYDAPNQQVEIGDVLRIYPRETYFESVNILLNYLSESENSEMAYKYMMNDVVRDMTNGIYEIYDNDGFIVDGDGSFSGNVIQKYQIQQLGKFELRKKLRN